MKILNIRTISGPNLYHYKPILIMTVDLGKYTNVSSLDHPDFIEKLSNFLPHIGDHRCSPGYIGGFLERLKRGTYMGHIIEHVALELSEMALIPVGFGKTV